MSPKDKLPTACLCNINAYAPWVIRYYIFSVLQTGYQTCAPRTMITQKVDNLPLDHCINFLYDPCHFVCNVKIVIYQWPFINCCPKSRLQMDMWIYIYSFFAFLLWGKNVWTIHKCAIESFYDVGRTIDVYGWEWKTGLDAVKGLKCFYVGRQGYKIDKKFQLV